jgi:hypothetical protein
LLPAAPHLDVVDRPPEDFHCKYAIGLIQQAGPYGHAQRVFEPFAGVIEGGQFLVDPPLVGPVLMCARRQDHLPFRTEMPVQAALGNPSVRRNLVQVHTIKTLVRKQRKCTGRQFRRLAAGRWRATRENAQFHCSKDTDWYGYVNSFFAGFEVVGRMEGSSFLKRPVLNACCRDEWRALLPRFTGASSIMRWEKQSDG